MATYRVYAKELGVKGGCLGEIRILVSEVWKYSKDFILMRSERN